MEILTARQKENIIFVLLLALGLFIAFAIKDIINALLASVILYTIFKPLNRRWTANNHLGKPLSALLIIILSFLIIIVPLFSFGYLIIYKIGKIAANTRQIEQVTRRLEEITGSKFNQPGLIENGVRNIEDWALSSLTSALSHVMWIIFSILIMYFIFYHMMVNEKTMEERIMKYLPFTEMQSRHFAMHLRNITNSNIIGQGIISVVQGILLGIGFLIFNISDAFFWSVMAIIVAFLPIIGTPLIFIPAGIIEWSYGNTLAGAGIILWGFLVIMGMEYTLRFIINRKMASTHPVITLLGIVIGVPFFGVLGLIAGPLLLSYFLLLIKIYETKFNHNSSLPLPHNH